MAVHIRRVAQPCAGGDGMGVLAGRALRPARSFRNAAHNDCMQSHVKSGLGSSMVKLAGSVTDNEDTLEPREYRPMPNDEVPLISDLAADPIFEEIVAEFVGNLPDRVRGLLDALTEGEVDLLRQLCHQMKGAGGGHGFPSITQQAARAERAVKSGASTSTITEEVEALVALLRRAHASVRA